MSSGAPAGMPPVVPVVDPQGNLVGIDSQHLAAALQYQGFRPPTAEQYAAFQARQAAVSPGQQAIAFAEGVGEGVLGPVIPGLEVAAGVDPEKIRARKEANPGWNTAGQVLGFVAPAVATLGTSVPEQVAAQGAVRAGAATVAKATLPGIATAAGEAVGKRVAGSVGTGVLGKAAVAGADFATQGAILGTSSVATRAVLQDPQLTGESAVAEVVLGAGLGGALGFGGSAAVHGLAGVLGKAGEKAVAFALSRAENPEAGKILATFTSDPIAMQSVHTLDRAGVSPNVLGAARHAETVNIIVKNAERVAELEAKAPGFAKEVLSRATPEEAQRLLAEGDKLILGHDAYNQAGIEFGDKISKTFQQVDRESRKVWTARSAEMEALAAKADPAAASAQAGEVFDRLDQAVAKIKAQKDRYASKAAGDIDDIAAGLVRDISEDPAQTFVRLNEVKQQLQGLANYGQEAGRFKARRTEQLIEGLARDVRLALEDEAVWGEAGARQRDFNKAFSEYMDAKLGIGAGKNAPTDSKIMVKIIGEDGETTYRANQKRVNEWMNAMGNGRSAVKSEGFADYLDAAEKLAGQMEKTGHEGAAELRAQIATVRGEVQETEARASITSLVERLKHPGKIRVSEGFIASGPQLATEAAISVAHSVPIVGHVTGAIEGAITRASQPTFAIGVVEALGKATARMGEAINGGVGRLFTGAASKAANEVGEAALTAKNYTQVSQAVRAHASDPSTLADATAAQTSVMSQHAPQAAAAAQMATVRAVHHLASKLPPEPPHSLFGGDYKPSPAELAAFNRAAKVVEKPHSILDEIRKGTVHQDHVDALASVYPAIHREMSAQIIDRLAQLTARKGSIPFQTRMGLALFLGGQFDPVMTPASMAANQQVLVAARLLEQAQAPGAAGPRSLDALGVAGRMATPMQASAGRA